MTIDELIDALQNAKEGSAELDLMCMKFMGEAPEGAYLATHGMWWCMFKSVYDKDVGSVKQRTSAHWGEHYYPNINWTSMSKKGFPKIDEWTAEINGPYSGLKGVHESLPIAMTIAALREYKEIEKLS